MTNPIIAQPIPYTRVQTDQRIEELVAAALAELPPVPELPDLSGVVYQDNLGEIGFPPVIQEGNELWASQVPQVIDADTSPNIVPLAGHLAIVTQNGVPRLVVGDGATRLGSPLGPRSVRAQQAGLTDQWTDLPALTIHEPVSWVQMHMIVINGDAADITLRMANVFGPRTGTVLDSGESEALAVVMPGDELVIPAAKPLMLYTFTSLIRRDDPDLPITLAVKSAAAEATESAVIIDMLIQEVPQ